MPKLEVESVGETVLVEVANSAIPIELTTREAFDVVTELLIHIDRARGYGEAARGEIKSPKYVESRGKNRVKGCARCGVIGCKGHRIEDE